VNEILVGSALAARERCYVDTDSSIILREFSRRFNEAVVNSSHETRPDPVDIENDLINDPDVVPADVHDNTAREIAGISKARKRAARDARREIAQVWSRPFTLLERCLALADFVNTRFVLTTFGVGSEVLKTKSSDLESEAVSGAYLKCLLLLSLFGKSCCVATEIFTLLEGGFSDGATSRLRTLHEYLVIIMLLHNDHTYEICERYQDRAVFERLNQVRVDKRAYKEPMWNKPQDLDHMMDQEIIELTAYAQRARSKWGRAIEEQYGWARPALPEAKRNSRKIFFSDLEEAAGMDFLRGQYLTGNERIHAGAYAAINHLDFASVPISPIRPHRNDEAIRFIGYRTSLLLGWIVRAASHSVSWETEEYDEFLYACEMQQLAEATMEAFWQVGASLSLSS
jgi:hypothetical protein